MKRESGSEVKMPTRIQRKRTRGWRMPPNTVYVGRPTLFMNPYRINPDYPEQRDMVLKAYRVLVMHPEKRKYREKIRRELRGKNLACWCRLDQACHADVLLEIANAQ